VASPAGIAVFGGVQNVSGLSRGGFFQNPSTQGRAVEGTSTATTGQTYAGYFKVLSTQGTAVYGEASATTGSGVGGTFTTASADGYGSYSFGPNVGSYGLAGAASGITVGVRGETFSLTDGYGVFSLGRFGASGTKSFRIDHPLDPENRYLIHYSAESPKPMNLYTGKVVTDERGYATVLLPDYFDEVNTEPLYQLTVVDTSDDFVMAKVSKRYANGKFQIRTSKPNVEVCWQVQAQRNDRFVKTYGAPTEIDKPDGEKGSYQHPELYGLGKERKLGSQKR
jgi:hypothetical protein